MPYKPSRVPAFIAPQIPVLSAEPPAGSGWIHEVKHDGYRTLLRLDRGQAQAFSRNGYDWTDKYARVIEACIRRASMTSAEKIDSTPKSARDCSIDFCSPTLIMANRNLKECLHYVGGVGKAESHHGISP
jgi:bifunctional non-homologous end joining protein LigD